MKNIILRIVLLTVIVLGFFWLIKILFLDKTKDLDRPLKTNNIKCQIFNIEPNQDTILKSSSGTLIYIPKNSFVDNNRKPIKTTVTIKLQEILNKTDMFFSGINTLSDNQILESGGMIKLSANANNSPLQMSKSSMIGYIVNTDQPAGHMKIFKGIRQGENLNWVDPVKLSNDTLLTKINQSLFSGIDNMDSLIESGVIKYDTKNKIYIFKNGTDKSFESLQPNEITEEAINRYNQYIKKGIDIFKINSKVSYLFESNNLEWINIDRFINETMAKPVDLKVIVTNANNYFLTEVKIIFKDRKTIMSLTQTQNRTFSLQGFNGKEILLPIGEEITVIAYSAKEDVPYVGYRNLILQKNQVLDLDIQPSSFEKIKEIINK